MSEYNNWWRTNCKGNDDEIFGSLGASKELVDTTINKMANKAGFLGRMQQKLIQNNDKQQHHFTTSGLLLLDSISRKWRILEPHADQHPK
jgi:hypothetical protein